MSREQAERNGECPTVAEARDAVAAGLKGIHEFLVGKCQRQEQVIAGLQAHEAGRLERRAACRRGAARRRALWWWAAGSASVALVGYAACCWLPADAGALRACDLHVVCGGVLIGVLWGALIGEGVAAEQGAAP